MKKSTVWKRTVGMSMSVCSVFMLMSCQEAGSPAITNMRCEYSVSPIGLDANTQPRFTWEYTGDDAFEQARCRVQIASSAALLADSLAEGDVWGYMHRTNIYVSSYEEYQKKCEAGLMD